MKATKEDTSGKEIGWFSVFTADKSVDKPILLISMVENVKGIGGSGYVVKKMQQYWMSILKNKKFLWEIITYVRYLR